jgi:hypothetical protein
MLTAASGFSISGIPCNHMAARNHFAQRAVFCNTLTRKEKSQSIG